MNIYFLVEGKRTERRLYPAWLSVLLPELKKVDYAQEVEDRNYYLISGEGYPRLKDRQLKKSFEEINEIGRFDYFVICFDADEFTVQERIDEINNYISEKNLQLSNNTKLILIIQNRCIETWLLGNRRIYSINPQNPKLKEYTKYYNVSKNDPELMDNDDWELHSQFHYDYLVRLLREKRISYTKKFPRDTANKSYLNQLKSRIDDEPAHLQSFQTFIEFCDKVNSIIAESD